MDNLEELVEQIQGTSFMNGQVSGVEIAAKKLREKSGELFANDCDVQSRMCRDMAQELTELAYELRNVYNERYRPQRDEALAKLDELQARLAA